MSLDVNNLEPVCQGWEIALRPAQLPVDKISKRAPANGSLMDVFPQKPASQCSFQGMITVFNATTTASPNVDKNRWFALDHLMRWDVKLLEPVCQ
jgi:hypothetical protein